MEDVEEANGLDANSFVVVVVVVVIGIVKSPPPPPAPASTTQQFEIDWDLLVKQIVHLSADGQLSYVHLGHRHFFLFIRVVDSSS